MAGAGYYMVLGGAGLLPHEIRVAEEMVLCIFAAARMTMDNHAINIKFSTTGNTRVVTIKRPGSGSAVEHVLIGPTKHNLELNIVIEALQIYASQQYRHLGTPTFAVHMAYHTVFTTIVNNSQGGAETFMNIFKRFGNSEGTLEHHIVARLYHNATRSIFYRLVNRARALLPGTADHAALLALALPTNAQFVEEIVEQEMMKLNTHLVRYTTAVPDNMLYFSLKGTESHLRPVANVLMLIGRNYTLNMHAPLIMFSILQPCLLYTSDAADE